jgi:hypothetical protein
MLLLKSCRLYAAAFSLPHEMKCNACILLCLCPHPVRYRLYTSLCASAYMLPPVLCLLHPTACKKPQYAVLYVIACCYHLAAVCILSPVR